MEDCSLFDESYLITEDEEEAEEINAEIEENEEMVAREERIETSSNSIATIRNRIAKVEDPVNEVDIIRLFPKRNGLNPIQISFVDDSPNLPRAFISDVYFPAADRNRPTTAHFNLPTFVNMSKTISRFHKYGVIGNYFSVGAGSFVSYSTAGSRNTTLVLHCCVARKDLRKDFILDRRMQKAFLKQYKPLYRFALKIIKNLSDDDVSIF